MIADIAFLVLACGLAFAAVFAGLGLALWLQAKAEHIRADAEYRAQLRERIQSKVAQLDQQIRNLDPPTDPGPGWPPQS